MLHSSGEMPNFCETPTPQEPPNPENAQQNNLLNAQQTVLRQVKCGKTFPVEWSNHPLAGGYYYPIVVKCKSLSKKNLQNFYFYFGRQRFPACDFPC
jgi:hypothetical protein